MNITTLDRSDLKQYFVANAIPTQSNFAELIDAGLNQRDDGIAKPPGDPLSIEAMGDPTSQRKVLNLYENFTDLSATWVLSLNPRGDPADEATARAGFSISDGAGNSRLFIDKSSGNVGIGTIAPGAKLHVEGGAEATLAGGGHLVLGSTASINIVFDSNEIQARNNGAASTLYLQPHGGLTYVGSGDLYVAGSVGIGDSNPDASLHVATGSEASLTSHGYLLLGSPTSGNLVFDTNEIQARSNGVARDVYLQPHGGVTRVGSGGLTVTGALHAAGSDVYFTETNHDHTGLGNTLGYAAIENAADYSALMILGRQTANGRKILLRDNVEVVGTFVNNSSREIKKDISALSASDYQKVIDQLRQTPVFRYRFKQEGIERKLHLGVIAEECPGEILDETGKSVSFLDFTGFLLAAVKAQQAKIEDLQAAVDRLG